MFKKILNFAFTVTAILMGSVSYSQGATCAEMAPICTDDGLSFTASDGATSEAGNNYGCLTSQPNPNWYYLEIDDSGDIIMSLTAGSDIDFIIWGPFDDLTDAQANCGTLGTTAESPEVDCSYSGSALEAPQILGAVSGEVYILLITNFADIIQDISLTQTGGDGSTNCGIIVIPPCTSYAGTFNIKKNDVFVSSDEALYLCDGDSYEIISNDDYILPNDTISAPVGDGIYTAEIMWLVYSAEPTEDVDPVMDPAYLDLIIPGEDLMDIHDASSPIVDELGCGTYYLVPVTGDDGRGDGADNDNSSVTWDKNANGCYSLGTPIQITYSCPITATITPNCTASTGTNSIDYDLNAGSSGYTIVSTGAGILGTPTVAPGGTANVFGFSNGDISQIFVTDGEGCTNTFTSTFLAPVINPITITPAVSCPDASVGTVTATVIDGSGYGGAYGISMNGTLTAGTTANLNGIAGLGVLIIASDIEGCTTDTVVTITSAGHFIDIEITAQTNISCFGANDGTATVTANPVNAAGEDDGELVSIVWTSPTGLTFSGDATNNVLADMVPGIWTVTVLDDFGCSVTIPVDITSPEILDLFLNTSNIPTCYGFSDGSIDLTVTGGTGAYTFSWKDLPTETDDVLNTIGSGLYTGYVTDENGCIDSLDILIEEPDSLHAIFTTKDVACFGESTGAIFLQEVVNGSGDINWGFAGATSLDEYPDVASISGLSEGEYVLIVQDEYCTYQETIIITENTPLVLNEEDTGYDPAYCRLFDYQSGNGQVYASASGGVADYNYLWEDLSDGTTTTNSTWGGRNPGDYKITAVDEVGCVVSRVITVDSLNPQALFTVTSEQLNADLKGTETVLANFTNESINYNNPNDPVATELFLWNLNEGVAPSFFSEDITEEFDTSYTGEQIYTVMLVAYNSNGCTDTLRKNIQVFADPIFVPFNVFSPDGDGINDEFRFNTAAKGVGVFSCVIVDRWGNSVFEFNDINQVWDGTRKNGNDSSDGTYFYTYSLEYTNGTTTAGQGNITLVRKK